MSEDYRTTRALIHLDHIDHNLDCIKKLTGGTRKICVAVKADAYGHGAVEISRRAVQWGVEFLAIATVNEALILRETGIEVPLILLTIGADSEIGRIVRHDIHPFVCDATYAKKLSTVAENTLKTVKVHLNIDTGMGRLGVTPEEAPALAKLIKELPGLELEGTCTHFPVPDSPEQDDIDFTKNQISLFNQTVEKIRDLGIDPGILHTANSGATIAYPEAHFDMVRPGISIYGYYPDQRMDKSVADLKPVMELVSEAVFIKKVKKGTSISYGRIWKADRETWIATIPIGYGDGYNRLLSSKGKVSIGGKLYPAAGRICMDQFMVDLGPETEVACGDRVVIFGPGENCLDAADIAEIIGSIPYEVTCAINKRVPRDYI